MRSNGGEERLETSERRDINYLKNVRMVVEKSECRKVRWVDVEEKEEERDRVRIERNEKVRHARIARSFLSPKRLLHQPDGSPVR